MNKMLYVTSLSGKKLNSFMMSAIIASKELGLETHIAANFSNTKMNDYLNGYNDYNIKLYHVDFKRNPLNLLNFRALIQMSKIIKDDYKIIHCNTPIGGLVTRLIISKKQRKLLIYQAHGFHFFDGASIFNWCFFYPIERFLARKTQYLITINEEDYQRSLKFRYCKKVKVNGVGISPFNIVPSPKSDSKIHFLSVGELNNNKNHMTVLKALSTLDIDYVYTIYGEGKKRKTIEKFVKNHGMIGKVFLPGYMTDVRKKLADFDVFIFPSKREGLSIALMEAMDAGLPCIVSNIRGNRDLIGDKGGIICDPMKSVEFKDAIKSMSLDVKLRYSFGMNNKENIKKFYLPIVVNQLKEVYLRVMRGQ